MTEEEIYQLAELLADEAYDKIFPESKYDYYDQRRALTFKFNEILLSKIKQLKIIN